MEGIIGEKGEGFAGTIIKDTWTITRGMRKQRREVGMAGVDGSGEGKMETTVLEQQLKTCIGIKKKKTQITDINNKTGISLETLNTSKG